MRKSVLLWLVLATFCGIALFHTSQKVHDEREKLAHLSQSIGKEEESIRVLQAEWGYLNQPHRLEKLAQNYLKLAPFKGRQFAKLEDIPLRPAAPALSPEPEIKTEKPQNNAVSAVVPPPVKIIRPALTMAPPIVHHPAAVSTASAPAHDRKFGDVMKSLGVE